MPIYSCDNGKYRIGDGECIYTSKEAAQRAYEAYLAQEDEDDDEKSLDLKEATYSDYPDSASNNAKRALKWKEENGSSCGTAVGWTRARQLASKSAISRSTIARMASFKRHQQHADVPYSEGCGGLMWDAWGGTSGIEWAIRKLDEIDNKKNNNMLYRYKASRLDVKDVDRKSLVVTGYFSSFGNLDSDGDIMMPGAFKRSIADWGPNGKERIKHLQNHNPNLPLGRITILKEDDFGLYYESKLVDTTYGLDFIKLAEAGVITEHSIGFNILNEQKSQNGNEIKDVKLFEGSSLTAWGANENTPLLGFKGERDIDDLKEEIRKFEKFIRNTDASDHTIDLCLIKVRQLAQAVEELSSTKVSVKEPEQPKVDEMLEKSLISILNNF